MHKAALLYIFRPRKRPPIEAIIYRNDTDVNSKENALSDNATFKLSSARLAFQVAATEKAYDIHSPMVIPVVDFERKILHSTASYPLIQ